MVKTAVVQKRLQQRMFQSVVLVHIATWVLILKNGVEYLEHFSTELPTVQN